MQKRVLLERVYSQVIARVSFLRIICIWHKVPVLPFSARGCTGRIPSRLKTKTLSLPACFYYMALWKKDTVSVIVVTAYLVLYCILLQFEATLGFAVWMFALSPVALIWMVLRILKHGTYNGPALGEEEFGYQDKDKEELGVW